MNEDIIEQSNFIDIAKDLQKDNKYLKIAESLRKDKKSIIIDDRESITNQPYLERFYYLNLRPFARIVIHRFFKSDIDGLHDHPWGFQNYIFSGGYWESTKEGKFWREPGYHSAQDCNFFHRIELDKNAPDTWTLFMMGPREQEWGFLDENGNWMQNEEYLDLKRK